MRLYNIRNFLSCLKMTSIVGKFNFENDWSVVGLDMIDLKIIWNGNLYWFNLIYEVITPLQVYLTRFFLPSFLRHPRLHFIYMLSSGKNWQNVRVCILRTYNSGCKWVNWIFSEYGLLLLLKGNVIYLVIDFDEIRVLLTERYKKKKKEKIAKRGKNVITRKCN